MSRPVRVLVVEDSPVQERLVSATLEADGRIRVVARAATVTEAVRAAAVHRPQVITMDLELPGGRGPRPGGLQAISTIMLARAVPILILSAHAGAQADRLAVEALAAGAADIFPKPGRWGEHEADQLRRRVLVLSRVPMTTRQPAARTEPPRRCPAAAGPVIGIVASTGGPGTLKTVISGLRGVAAPILLVQHIHPTFAASFAEWLTEETGVPVILAEDGTDLIPGTVYLAPPNRHLRLTGNRRAHLDLEPADAINRPSGDELLSSIAVHAGARGIGCVLTGMGRDGADGLAELRAAGGLCFAQDGESAVVDGMPRAARENGAAERILPPDRLGAAIAEAVRR